MIDEYDQKRKADNLRKLMEDEEEKKRKGLFFCLD